MTLAFTTRGNTLFRPDGAVLEDYLWDRSELCVIQGPIGSGTSTCSIMRIWRLACEQKADNDKVRRSRWIVTRGSYRELKKTTIKTWLEWFPEHEWGEMVRSEPMTHHLKRDHPSGDGTTVDCEVIFIAIPDAATAEQVAASFEITGFFVNEGQFFEKEVIDELLSRCGRYPSRRNGPGATWHGGMVDLNAPIEGHWIPYMRGDMPLPSHWTEAEIIEYTKPETWRFLVQPPGLLETRVDGKLVYQPNPNAENQRHLTKTYMEQIRGKKKEWIDRRILNKVGLYMDGKPVYASFVEGEHVNPYDREPVAGLSLIVGMDFGRDPSAIFCQCVNGAWTVLSELIGDNESAEKFAPRVKRHLAEHYPGFHADFYGDPRGADGGQNVETTAYDVFQAGGMRILPATTDNNPEMRRSAVDRVLLRRNGLRINPKCLVTKTGMAGGYHYPRVKGLPGVFREQPLKNKYSHAVEGFENAVLGGGEGYAVVRGSEARPRPKASPVKRHKVRMRRYARH